MAIIVTNFPREAENKRETSNYYRLKELLLQFDIPSQAIFNDRVNDPDFVDFIPNFSTSILAKLEGIPWKVADLLHCPVIGIGLFKSGKKGKEQIRSVAAFTSEEVFNSLECFPSHDAKMLAGAIRMAVKQYNSTNQKAERLVIHYCKSVDKAWLAVLEEAFSLVGLDIPVFLVGIFRPGNNDYIAWDVNSPGLMPISGTILRTAKRHDMLYNNQK